MFWKSKGVQISKIVNDDEYRVAGTKIRNFLLPTLTRFIILPLLLRSRRSVQNSRSKAQIKTKKFKYRAGDRMIEENVFPGSTVSWQHSVQRTNKITGKNDMIAIQQKILYSNFWNALGACNPASIICCKTFPGICSGLYLRTLRRVRMVFSVSFSTDEL